MVAFERRLAGESRVIRGLCSNHGVCDNRESCWMRKNSEPGGLGADISEATDHPVWQFTNHVCIVEQMFEIMLVLQVQNQQAKEESLADDLFR